MKYSRKEIFQDIIRRFRPFKSNIIIGIICTFVFTGIQIARPILLRWIIDIYVPAKDIDGIIYVASIYFFLLLISLISSYQQVILLSTAGMKVVNKYKADIYENILKMDRDYFSKNPTGTLLARIESDTEQVKELFSSHSLRLFTTFLMMIGICVSIYINTTGYAFYFFIMLLLSIFCLTKVIKRIRSTYDNVREAYRELSGFLAEYIRGIPTIQVFDVKDSVCESLDVYNRKKFKFQKKVAIMNYSFLAVLSLFTDTLVVASIIYFGCKSISLGLMSIGTLIMLIEYTRLLFHPLFHLSEELGYMQNGLVSLDRMYGVMGLRPEITGGTRKIESEDGKIDIRFEDVWFAYIGEEWVLKGVSFDFPFGNSVAIVGASGSGKSTIIKLLFRFYEINKGRITINGVDIREYSLESLRHKLGLVLQDVYFFPGTLLDNLRVLDESIGVENVSAASKKLGLDGFIDSLPEGIDSQISEGGKNFSSGERQIFAFTRALTYNPSVLVLDEATSFIDTHTEKLIKESLSKAFQGKSILLIAHRLSTVTDVDNIIVLSNGEIIENGNHKQLMELEGTYYEMRKLQNVEIV
ncbi:ABC transporter ATP-binding protein [bacterium]|nr:ABC transporter ATP-binding protein [bacterium]